MVAEGLPARLGVRRDDLIASGRRARLAVLLTTGLLSGFVGLARTGHLLDGALQAVLSGVAFGVAATLMTEWRLRTLRHLSVPERLQVVRAARHGTAPADARLAQATLDHVACLRRSGATSAPMIGLVFVAAGLLALSTALHQPLVLAAEGGVVGAWHTMLSPLGRRRRDAQRSALHFAERQARETLGLPPVAPARTRPGVVRIVAIVLAAATAAVVVGAETIDYVRSLPYPHTQAEIDRDPGSAGYHRFTTVAGTTVWLRRQGIGTLWIKATGAVEEACSVAVEPYAGSGDSIPIGPGSTVYPEPDQCTGQTRRHGGMFAYFFGGHGYQGAIDLADGTPAHASARVDLTHYGAPGISLVLYLVPRADITMYRS